MFTHKLPKEAGGYVITGRSRAADATCIAINDLNWILDCGAIVTHWRPERVFITHTHCDHSNRVTHVVSRHKPPTIYVPKSAAPLVDGYINAMQAMTDNRPLDQLLIAMENGPPEWRINRIIEPVEKGNKIEILKGGKNWEIEVIECDHSVPCVGYAFREKKKILKEEYRNIPGKELGNLRKQGIEINREELVNRFVFMGDTEASVFEKYPELLDFPVIITECTFLSEDEIKNAKKTKHTHWNDLKPFVENNPKSLFILIHFSLRYSNSEISQFFQDEKLNNVLTLIGDDNESAWID